MAAASPLRGSIGFGYVNNWGRNDSKILERSKRENRELMPYQLVKYILKCYTRQFLDLHSN
jgi:hypothetical protein